MAPCLLLRSIASATANTAVTSCVQVGQKSTAAPVWYAGYEPAIIDGFSDTTAAEDASTLPGRSSDKVTNATADQGAAAAASGEPPDDAESPPAAPMQPPAIPQPAPAGSSTTQPHVHNHTHAPTTPAAPTAAPTATPAAQTPNATSATASPSPSPAAAQPAVPSPPAAGTNSSSSTPAADNSTSSTGGRKLLAHATHVGGGILEQLQR